MRGIYAAKAERTILRKAKKPDFEGYKNTLALCLATGYWLLDITGNLRNRSEFYKNMETV